LERNAILALRSERKEGGRVRRCELARRDGGVPSLLFLEEALRFKRIRAAGARGKRVVTSVKFKEDVDRLNDWVHTIAIMKDSEWWEAGFAWRIAMYYKLAWSSVIEYCGLISKR